MHAESLTKTTLILTAFASAFALGAMACGGAERGEDGTVADADGTTADEQAQYSEDGIKIFKGRGETCNRRGTGMKCVPIVLACAEAYDGDGTWRCSNPWKSGNAGDRCYANNECGFSYECLPAPTGGGGTCQKRW